MQIIIAPAKKMVINTNDFEIQGLPIYIEETRQILQKMQTFSYEEAQTMWHCSDKLARPNYAWLQKMNLSDQLTPAIISYTVFNINMAPDLFTAPALAYVQANLVFYRLLRHLRPFDGVAPYRLEMQAGSR